MKYHINKFGNYGTIAPVPTGVLAATLDKYLQYTRQGAQFMPHPEWAIVRFYKLKTGKFPWGLIHLVKDIMDKYCETGEHEYTIDRLLVYPLDSLRRAVTGNLRPYQIDAIMALTKNHGGILMMPCGAGKTLTLIEFFRMWGWRTLVIVPSIDIRKQWEDYKLPNVTVSTYQNPQLKVPGVMESYQMICFDEAHHTSAKTIFNHAMKTNTNAMLIGCSATIKRDDGEDMRIYAALGKIVYQIERKELIRQGFLANAVVTYLKPTFTTNGKYMEYQKVYDIEIVHNTHRNMLIWQTAVNDTRNHRKVLILVSTIEHGEILLDMLSPLKDELKIIFMNGQSKNRDQDMSVYDIIIATSIYDEGYNLPSLDTLILAAGGKSSIKLTQRIGRVLRLKTDGRFANVYDFIDTPKYLRQQYMKRRRILEEEFEIIEQEAQTKLGGM